MIQFKKVILHNFGSYGHTELDLQNRGFCLVSGQNNYKKDNALSNGSGKSFLWSAICFALTGETINGIKTNLKNINIEDSECYVQLDFLYNKDVFSIVRHATPKSELHIIRNDLDISGKGIRESEKRLQEAIPDLTKDLIASIIIIGQGMPNKFSSFSPSGRKELLEKLTKSDFMIEDLKTRIVTRQQELSLKIRELEDSLLAHKTRLSSLFDNVAKLKESIDFDNKPDFDSLISEALARLAAQQESVSQYDMLITELEQNISTVNAEMLSLSNEKSKVSNEELSAYTASFTALAEERIKLESSISSLKKEINRIKSIVDTCPTCGQHIPNVQKPSSAEQEAALADTEDKLAVVFERITKCNNQHKSYISQINNAFCEDLERLHLQLENTKRERDIAKQNRDSAASLVALENANYNKLVYDKQNWDIRITAKQAEIRDIENEISRLTNIISLTSISKDELDRRLAIVKKMDTLIRRDFRGYLLTNIINYIDTRAKEYCNTVFGTVELSISINGNALDITYCGKAFDGLSGGEKQRVDLILQLAIRDLLMSYLGIASNILVLDEVTDFLDKKSCKAVMTLLEKELKTTESVFIISHHAEELEIPIDSEISVVKNTAGISELY